MTGTSANAQPGRICVPVSGLAARLFPLETPIGSLPIGGYRPEDLDRPRPAAVLIGVTDESDPRVLLTVRSRDLPLHAGQVAFPGGAREHDDVSVVETALRETSEETGVDAASVRPLGYLGRYDTVTGYRITALVGALAADFRARPDRREVETVFTVPLEHVADEARYRCDRVVYRGMTFEVLTLEHSEHYIWGATAALLHRFGQLAAGQSGSRP